jgi:hypothetical protein
MKHARLLVSLVGLAFVACQDNQPVGPTVPSGPFLQIRDGHEVGGNPGFFFLAPIRRLADDATVPRTGFNPDLAPVIDVYECSGTNAAGCVLPLGALKSRITKSSGTILLNRLYVLPKSHEYAALWDTKNLALRTDRTYRIQVSVGGQVLGFADVDVVRTIRELAAVNRDDFVPMLQNFILPIRFWIGNNALCTGACSSETITLAAGGTVELTTPVEHFKFDIRSGTTATSGDNPVTEVTFNLEVCNGIDVDLPKVGQCLRVTTFFDAAGGASSVLRLSKAALVSMCSFEPAEGQEGLVTLHQQDGDLIRALPHAVPNCEAPIPSPRLGARGWQWIRDFAAKLFMPQQLYASSRTALLHLGGGGETNLLGAVCPAPSPVPGMALAACMPGVAPLLATPPPTSGHTISDFQFALPAKMEYVDPDDASRSATAGTSLPTAVKVTDWNNVPVQGATITFTEPALEGPGTVIGTATSNASGIAEISWSIATGTTAVIASGRGVAARNNYPEGPVKPFMPDIFSPAPQSPVIVRDGAVPFAVHVIPPLGFLGFVQQPADQIANLRTFSVVILAEDAAGAALPGVLVTLKDGPQNSALGCGMGGAERTALTDETGRATFSLIDVSSACDAATLVATGSKAGLAPMSVESESFAIADLGGRGTPIIDGELDEAWGEARCLQFAAEVPEEGTTPAMLCAMNDDYNVYFFVRFSRASDPQSSVDFQFDQNRSGGINSGDDLIIFRNPQFTFEDDHWFDSSVSELCPVGSLCSRSDAAAGGTVNGQGAFGNNGGETVFEVAHPLQSGDNHDISVGPGQTIDFVLGLNIFASATAESPARTFFRSGRLLKLLVK